MSILQVKIESGLVAGIEKNGVVSFKGIPYAKAGRLLPPSAPESWTGIRLCDQFGPSPVPGRAMPTPTPAKEDCLSLNIWTAAEQADSGFPVMVWFYGGAFQHGSSADPDFDGEALAQKGVVLVTVNYRVGALGFGVMDGKGNFGTRDQVAALQWIQRNIRAFGGDPGCVTIFGQSAGGISCRILLTSPKAKGLFHRVIIESGGGLNEADLIRPMEEMDAIQKKTIEKLGMTVEEALSLPANEFNEKLCAAAKEVVPGEVGVFQPCIDGEYIVEVPGKLLADGKYPNDVDVICGTVAGDAWMFCRKAAAQIGENDALLRGVSYSPSHSLALAALRGGKKPIHTYYMERTQPTSPFHGGHGGYHYGAQCPHSAEIRYVFGTLSPQHTEYDKEISRALMSYWTNFAKIGDPNGAGSVSWPAYTEETPYSLHITDDAMSVENVMDSAEGRAFTQFTLDHPGMLEVLAGLESYLEAENRATEAK